MAWQWCRLMLAACALSALVTSGSTRTTNDDGICTRVIQFVAFEGQRAVSGTTLTYSASERKFRKAADEVCCSGWRRDPDSEKLRCVKIDTNDSAGVGGADIATDLGNGEESSIHRDWNVLKKEAGLQNNVRRPRDSPSGSENTSAGSSHVNTGQSASHVSDGHSVQNLEQGLQNQAARGDGKAVSGAGQSSQANSAAAGPKGDQPVGPPSSNSDGTQSKPNTASSAVSSRDTAHTSGEKQNPPVSSQEPSKSGSLPQAASTSSHPEGLPHAVPSESKSSASSHSATDHSDVEAQTPAEKEHNDQHGDSSQTRGAAGSVSSSAATAPSAATTVAPQAKDPIINQTVATKAQPQSTPSNISGPIAHTETTASSVAITPSKSEGSASPEVQGNNDKTANNSVVSVSVHPDQNISLTVQSTQDNASLQPTSKDPAHPPREETVPSPASFQSTSAPTTVNPTVLRPQDAGLPTLTGKDLGGRYHVVTETSTVSIQPTSAPSIPTTTTTSYNNTNTSLTNTSSNTTDTRVSHQELNATHPAESENSVHTVPSAVLGTTVIPISTSATATTGSTRSLSHGDTTAARVASTTRIPASHHPKVQPDNNTTDYNVTVNTSSGIKSTTQGASTGKSSVATGQQGNVSAANTTDVKVNGTSVPNCSLFEHQKNCSDSNDTTSAVRSQSPLAPSVAKPHAGGATAEPSDGSASKTASEVTISLLLVAAVAFVAGLLYWRTRRRRRRYINCGTREPNLHFSNPVYDLEAMMEQTSLVKLQNAADIEDGDGDDTDHEATSQRK